MDAGPVELTVAELADAAGVSVRTVRYYQAEGLLPPPDRAGRVARYGPEHSERLALITSLQARGLRLSTIRELLAGTDPEWLGLDVALRRPWSEDRPAILDDDQLAERLDGLPAGTREQLVAAGTLERRDDTRPAVWFVPSPGMLDVAIEAARLGIPPDAGRRLRALLESHLSALSRELVDLFAGDVAVEHLADGGPTALADLLAQVQPLARRTVDLVFAHEMERAQRRLLDEGLDG